jgi:hypothetical protein
MTVENIMNIELHEVGYTPENLRILLYTTLPDIRNRREWLSEKLGVSLDTVHRWCVEPTSNRHVNMSLKNWRATVAVTEARDSSKRLNITYPEAGYTPNNLTTLLYLALPDAKARREWLAYNIGVSLDTVHRWSVELTSKRHVDMSLVKWRRALVVTEVDHALMKLELQDEILNELPENLYDRSDSNPPKGWLAISYQGWGEWKIDFTSDRSDKTYDVHLNVGYNEHSPRIYDAHDLSSSPEDMLVTEADSDEAELWWEDRDLAKLDTKLKPFEDLNVRESFYLHKNAEMSAKAYLNPPFTENYTEEEMNVPRTSDDEANFLETQNHIRASIKEWVSDVFNAAGPTE